MPRALLSVYDKTGLQAFAQALSAMGWDLVASGGTAHSLELAGLAITSIETLTQTPSMLAGRVKTLHPAVHAGILARDTEEDLETLGKYGYAPIDLVVCNLYPFQTTVAQDGVALAEAIEQIDIGGVTLVRAAAKNFARVAVVVDPADYDGVVASLRAHGRVDEKMRQRLARKAFRMTRDYDTAIHGYFERIDEDEAIDEPGDLPEALSIGLTRIQALRYGENGHQAAALYSDGPKHTPLGGEVLGGKALSYNNLLDVDSAWRAVNAFETPSVVIVKHMNPTGIASGAALDEAFAAALESDPVSAFGGVIGCNRAVDEALVQALGSLFVEVIVAPHFTPTAEEMLASGRKNCRLLRVPDRPNQTALELRSIVGGYLVQQTDAGDPQGTAWRVVTDRKPTSEELQALRFSWKAVQYVKSNAIVIAHAHTTVGIGGGLPSRVDAVRLAVEKAGERARGAALASDAFFPFADGIEAAVQAGVTCVVQPGGSIRDQDVIAAANAADLAMVFTGVRHFRH